MNLPSPNSNPPSMGPEHDTTVSTAGPYLPPVDPPSASFFMQLFVTPLLIVSVIVGLWFVASWLVNSEGRPEKLVEDIEQLNHGSWQKALTLANQLRNTNNHELRTNTVIANRLAEVLENQLQGTSATDSHHWLTLFVCRALGEFEIDVGIPSLIHAAQPRQTLPRRDPRRAAIEGLALLATHLEPGAMAQQKGAVDAILKATDFPSAEATENEDRREQRRLRSTATYALGIVGGEQALNRLRQLRNDTDGDVRQNAVVALARLGERDVLLELTALLPPSDDQLLKGLDAELSGLEAERMNELDFKRNLTTSAAIQGLVRLIDGHAELNLDDPTQALEKIKEDKKFSADVRQEALEALGFLRARKGGYSQSSSTHDTSVEVPSD